MRLCHSPLMLRRKSPPPCSPQALASRTLEDLRHLLEALLYHHLPQRLLLQNLDLSSALCLSDLSDFRHCAFGRLSAWAFPLQTSPGRADFGNSISESFSPSLFPCDPAFPDVHFHPSHRPLPLLRLAC